ncbi:MAG: hypothetical protein ABJP82_17920 [Hyphomicrobiales bacterium]
MRMAAVDLQNFIQGKELYAYDPVTREKIAQVTYGSDGRCVVMFANGTNDRGTYGFLEDTYWTRYDVFRNGETNSFYLTRVGPELAQAYHLDGRPAYLQSPDRTLS